MATADDVAAAVIEYLRRDAAPGTWSVDTFKLQKLVYYCQAWHLVWDDEELFSEPIEAWAGGPVVRTLYDKHRGKYAVSSWAWGDVSQLSESQRETVSVVVDAYGKFTGRQLSALTHSERPWRDARRGLGPGERGNRVISLSEMADFYSALDQDESATPVSDL